MDFSLLMLPYLGLFVYLTTNSIFSFCDLNSRFDFP